MKYKNYILVIMTLALVSAGRQSGAMTNYYAAVNGPHQPPFDAWDKAASNIQDVITLARDGDVINLSNGTFVVTGMLDVAYAVAIHGEYGPDQTILTGAFPDYTNRCFDVRHDNAWLDGLTISNFYCEGNGGGVQLQRGNMINCHVTHNQTIGTARFGGGVCAAATWTGLVTQSRISYNINTQQFGGGMALLGVGIVRNCDIYGNNGYNVGGVFFNKGIIEQCVIRDNISAGNPGGGVGGSANVGPNVILRNSLIMRNRASSHSGGAYKASNSFSIVNCTIVSNYAASSGGLGLLTDANPDRKVVFNCIIVSNFNGAGANSDIYLFTPASQSNFFFNCCVGSYAGAYALSAQQGNIQTIPMFVNPDPANPDYRLLVNSPCVNTGTNHPALGALDLDGYTRVDRYNGLVDMGCYEYFAKGTLYHVR